MDFEIYKDFRWEIVISESTILKIPGWIHPGIPSWDHQILDFHQNRGTFLRADFARDETTLFSPAIRNLF